MDSEKYTLPGFLQDLNDQELNNNHQLIDTFKALLVKYPYIYVRYMLDKTVSEMAVTAADNAEQVAHYDTMINHQSWAKKE